ncbi:M20/M25/M40 family metallo-hydrolase, partial [Nevskia sp.]|uniref:M20/M25/M40 family metallo-hydrolase n=1 Tax=Nevskia sp. TaxID=1929292 RepID=UPI00345B390F
MLFASGHVQAATHSADPSEAAFRALYKELVETNTTLSAGSCTLASERMAARLLAAGLPAADIELLGPADRPKEKSLIATLRGRDPKAATILLLAHVDVVEARREDWQRDPFTLVEENGFFYARGVSDDKAMAAVLTDSLIRYLQTGFKPRRTLKLALTCGEETADSFNSVAWLLKHHPDALKAAFALNEGAGGELDADGRPSVLQIQAGEKVYQDFALEISNGGGHSSRPVPDNAIYRLSAALGRIGVYQFPLALNPVTTAYFQAQSNLVPNDAADAMKTVLAQPVDGPATAALWALNPGWNSMLRTTCVATQISA